MSSPYMPGPHRGMLLALDSEEVIDDYVARRSPLRSFTAKTVTDPVALRRTLAESRRAAGRSRTRTLRSPQPRSVRRYSAANTVCSARLPSEACPRMCLAQSKSGLSKPW